MRIHGGIHGGAPAFGRRTTAVLALVLTPALAWVLGACSGDPGGSGAAPSPTPASVPVSVGQPHAPGPFAVELEVGLAVLTPTTCDPANARRVCSLDRSHSWAPLGSVAPATVADVRTRLAHGHTSWTTVVAFTHADRPALRQQARRATSLGGVVLVLDTHRQVLAAVPASTIHDVTAVLTDLEKPVAWGLVQGFQHD